jgi:hypothetical protein
MSAVPVNVDNFVRAETNRMFANLLAGAGDSPWLHFREPVPLDHQTVIRMNRDTLYSAAIVDTSEGVTVTIPASGDRYLSVMVVNQDHYINNVLHDPGEHTLSAEQVGTPYALIAARILVDPANPADVAAVNALQDELGVTTPSARPFALPEYDEASFDGTRESLLTLARGLDGYSHSFGRADEVDPVRHLIGTASGWGGLPEDEAFYVNVEPSLPVGEYTLTVPPDVPVDAFWSISVYNADGFFEPNDRNANTLNSITAQRDSDGSVVVHFGGCGDNRPNCLPIVEGWNYLVRLYRPHPEVIDGSWHFPSIGPA